MIAAMLRRSRFLSLALLTCAILALAQDARDAWQRPAEVMDALEIRAGSRVADVGAGDGYFTAHLAERVGPQGRVYAEDIDPSALAQVRGAADKKGMKQVETILGSVSDPKLPANSLDAVLIVNAYHEMDEHDAMLAGIRSALKHGGRLGIIDKESEPGHDRSWYHSHHRIAKSVVRQEAEHSGFRFVGEHRGFQRPSDGSKWYFLIFQNP